MTSFHMTPDEFRQRGIELVEWVARYLETVEDYPVLSQVKPGEIRGRLPEHPPEQPESWEAIVADLDEIILPGITHWQSPNFYAFFNGNSSGPSVLGEMVSAGISTQGMNWATAPAATELETHVLDWLAEMIGLPSQFTSSGTGGGVIQDTASTATLIAALAARERATGWTSNKQGVPAGLTAYTSSEAHSSVEKAISLSGIGSDNLRLISVDERYAMVPEALEDAMSTDVAAGLTPAFVVATIGTTSSLAMDPVRAIAEAARRHHAWVHVDAAWAGTAAICPEFRHFQDGVELADSYLFNPHKWMFTNLDCDAFYVADREALIKTMSIMPEYLRSAASDAEEVWDYRNWQIALGRRFRALKLWFVIRHYGVEGLRHHVRRHVEMAQGLAARVEDHPSLELVSPVALTLICFRHLDGDEASNQIVKRLNASGDAYVTHAQLDGRYVVRVNIGQTYTEQRHVDALWEMIEEAAISH